MRRRRLAFLLVSTGLCAGHLLAQEKPGEAPRLDFELTRFARFGFASSFETQEKTQEKFPEKAVQAPRPRRFWPAAVGGAGMKNGTLSGSYLLLWHRSPDLCRPAQDGRPVPQNL